MPPVPKPRRKPKKGRKPIRRSRVRQKAGKPRRFRARRDEAYAEWIRDQDCLLRLRVRIVNGKGEIHYCASGPTQACHVQSRGAGGSDRANLWPGCAAAHEEQHRVGIRSFQQHWGLNLKKIAQQYTERYDRERSVG